MSLYNMMCGNNPLFGLYSRILESVEPLPKIPRFRDMYTREQNGAVQIVLYTRTGGGNREGYEVENNAIEKHPLFVETFDDSFDTTFAHWVFSVPEKLASRLLEFHKLTCEHPKFCEPSVKFGSVMASLKGEPANNFPVSSSERIGELLVDFIEEFPNQSSLEVQLQGGH